VTPVAITIDDLRQDWLRQIEAYNEAIAVLEREKQSGVGNLGRGKPARVWMEMLQTWRDELKGLLAQYPGG